jgi:adenylate kinase family enzyme
MTPQTLIFIGRSGCGKGTQAKMIIDYLKMKSENTPIYYLESGAAFRDFVAGESHTAKLSRKVYEAGGLQPEFLAISIWSNLLIHNLIGGEHLVIDGTPRKLREAHVLDSAFKFYEREKPHLIYLNVLNEWSKERLMGRGRPDDKRTEIESRLRWFDTDVLPAINFFKNNPDYSFHDINGEQSIEKVGSDILESLAWPK